MINSLNQSVIDAYGRYFGSFGSNIIGVDQVTGAPILLGLITVFFMLAVCYLFRIGFEASLVILFSTTLFVVYIGWLPTWIGIIALVIAAIPIAQASHQAIFGGY